MKRRLGSTVVVVLIALAATSSGGATATGKLCSRFTHGRITYQSQTVGTSWSCGAARTWIMKLTLDRVPKTVTKNIPLENGPRGLHCLATPLSGGGHATGGMCIKGTPAFPKSGFAWFPV